MGDIEDDFSAFVGIKIVPGKTTKVTVPENMEFALSNAAVANSSTNPTTGRVVLYAKVNDGPEIAIVPFLLGSFESTKLELQFIAGDIINFRTQGTDVTIDLAGHLNGGFSLNIQ